MFGPYVNSFFEFTHYAFGGVCATSAIRTLALHFGFGAEQACSAAARVTSSLPISGLPFVFGSSSLLFFYEAFPHSEVRRLWAILWVVHSPFFYCVLVPCGTLLYAVVTSSGADGRVSRLRSTSPSAIVFSIPSFLCTCSGSLSCTGAVGRVSRPRSSTWTFSLLRISSIALFTRMRIACSSSLFHFLNFQVAWSGVRLLSSAWFPLFS